MEGNKINNLEDVIDSRDVLDRITELQAMDMDTEEEEELEGLQMLIQDIADTGLTPADGITLIRETYFTEYAQELAEDVGAISSTPQWPLSHIDWDAAAEELQGDYVSVEFRGIEYFCR